MTIVPSSLIFFVCLYGLLNVYIAATLWIGNDIKFDRRGRFVQFKAFLVLLAILSMGAIFAIPLWLANALFTGIKWIRKK